MNKTLKLALGAVLTAGMILPVFAQDNFPDVPDNHWAYEALARLKKDGLLVGYPDGLFRGNRPASRYELAVAINATYVHLKSITDGLQAEIDDLKGRGTVDLQPLKDAIQQLQDEVNNMKGWGDDIDNLKKLADQFQKELASLGVDVEGLKKDLADLAKRVGVLEAHRLPIDIHGDVNMLMLAGGGSGQKPGIAVDGRPVGVRIPYTSGPQAGIFDLAGMDVDSTIYHELDLRLTSNNENGPKWHGDVAVGNMFGDSFYGQTAVSSSGIGGSGRANGAAFGSMSSTGPNSVPFAAGQETVYVQDLAVDFDTSIVNQGLNVELGRTGYSIDPYMFQRPNPDPYYQNDRWGDGKWYFDGGILGFHWGGVGLDAFAGKQDAQTTAGAGTLDMEPMTVGALGHPYTPGTGALRPVGLQGNTPPGFGGLYNGGAYLSGINVDEDLGLRLHIPISTNGKLDLAYIWFESNYGESATGAVPTAAGAVSNAIANHADVYGGDLKWNFGSLVFDGGYSASDLKMGNSNLTSKDNFAWHAGLAYDGNKWGASAGYRDIEPQYGAPGDWGRIGIWWNPTDIKGPMANLHLNLSNVLKLTAGGEWYNGTGDKFGNAALGTPATQTGLSTHDRIDHYTAELGWRMNDAWNLTLGTEMVYWHLPEAATGTTNPTEMWYNLGLGYNLSDQARLSFLYQWSSYDSKGNSDFQVFSPAYSGSKYMGSLLTTQLTVKF